MAIKKIEIKPPVIDENGKITYPDTLYPKTSADLVETDDGSSVQNQLGVLSENLEEVNRKVNAHQAEKATKTTLGHVKIGSGINVNAEGEISVSQVDGIPSGIIAMWSGSIASIPNGWALCDGQNGTPNLTDRFIVGAGKSYNVGDTGGADSVSLTTSQLPSHSHGSGTLSTSTAGSHSHGSGTLSTSTAGSHSHTYDRPQAVTNGSVGYSSDGNLAMRVVSNRSTSSSGSHSHSISGSTASAGSHSHSVTGTTSTTGSGQAHENRPPYYALAYIMKL